MKLIKFIAFLGFAMPFLANADDLKITNNVNADLSFQVNNVCSNIFKISPNQTKVISEKDFSKACEANSRECQAIAFLGENCKSNFNFAFITMNPHDGIMLIGSSIPERIKNKLLDNFHLVFYP